MIEPDMATLLTFFFTDAAVDAADDARRDVPPRRRPQLQRALDRHRHLDQRLGDRARLRRPPARSTPPRSRIALGEVALELVRQIAGDGEGATKVIEATVTGARDDAQAKRVAKADRELAPREDRRARRGSELGSCRHGDREVPGRHRHRPGATS